MLNNVFEGICIPVDALDEETLNLLCLAANCDYCTALEESKKIICKQTTQEEKNIARMIFALLTALSGDGEAGLGMLKILKKELKSYKARKICKKAIRMLN